MGWNFKDPNRKSNHHKFGKIVSRHDLPRARQEAYNRFKREGDTEHMALVRTLNFVGVRDSKSNEKRHKRG